MTNQRPEWRAMALGLTQDQVHGLVLLAHALTLWVRSDISYLLFSWSLKIITEGTMKVPQEKQTKRNKCPSFFHLLEILAAFTEVGRACISHWLPAQISHGGSSGAPGRFHYAVFSLLWFILWDWLSAVAADSYVKVLSSEKEFNNMEERRMKWTEVF